jgi:hypothetical protein
MVLLIASLFLVTTFLNIFFTSLSVHRFVSLDWADYVVFSDLVNPKPVVVSVSGSWTVPRIEVSQEDMFSDTWIGIGGQLDNTLIQAGTEQDSINGQGNYSAWYELLPNGSVTITTLNISSGDKIVVSINLVDSATNEWSIEINDVTTGQGFEQNFFYNSSRLSAEWIVERPTVDHSLSTLADFGNITFTNSNATMDTHVGTINKFPFAQVIMQNRRNRQLVTVSSLTPDGSGFTVNHST